MRPCPRCGRPGGLMYCPTCHGPRPARTAWEAYGREIAVTVDPPDEFGQFRAEFSVGGKVRYEAFFTDKREVQP